MPNNLSDKQRQWLDAALKAKGRFTMARTVKKDWEDYVRRREKAAAGGAGLLPDDPKKKLVDDGLKHADGLAKAGKFAEAYKSLDAIKTISAAASVDRARAVSVDGLRVRLNVFRSKLDDVASLCDFAEGHFKPLLDRMAQIESAAAKPTLREATLRLKEFASEEMVLLADLSGREDYANNASTRARRADLGPELDAIDRDIAVHAAAGHRDLVQAHADRAATYRQKMTLKRFYTYPDAAIGVRDRDPAHSGHQQVPAR
jgi:hypothetical protein